MRPWIFNIYLKKRKSQGQKYEDYGGNRRIKNIFNHFQYDPIVKSINLLPKKLGWGISYFFNLEIIDIKVKLLARNFIKISRVQII